MNYTLCLVRLRASNTPNNIRTFFTAATIARTLGRGRLFEHSSLQPQKTTTMRIRNAPYVCCCSLWTVSTGTALSWHGSLPFRTTTTTSTHFHPFSNRPTNKARSLVCGNSVRLLATKKKNKIRNRSKNKNDSNAEMDDDFSSLDPSSLPFASEYHAPVMWNECIEGLLSCDRAQQRQQQQQSTQSQSSSNPSINLIFVDGTLGGGGHSEALLQALQPGDVVFGCDVDANALQEASQRLEMYMHSPETLPLFVPVQSNFAQLAHILPRIRLPNKENNNPNNQEDKIILPDKQHCVDGILLDLGVSSHQIDTPERGFAFMKDGPLDMRMNMMMGDSMQSSLSSLTAADLCNELEESELAHIFQQHGDESSSRAKSIAKSIVQHRPLQTTGQLQQAVAAVVPAFCKHSKRQGLTATLARVFQSLRIVVNKEDKVLQQVLQETCPQLLRPGGRLVVLSYHSMEDRATKRVMRDGSTAKQRGSPERDIYGDYVGPAKPFRPIGKFQKASEEEVAQNSRARSATLRIAERLTVVSDAEEERQ